MPSAGDDRLETAEGIVKSSILGATPLIAPICQHRFGANAALEHRQGAVDAGVRTGDTGDADGNGFDAAEVVTWAIHVEEFFGEGDGAAASGQQLEIARDIGYLEGEEKAVGNMGIVYKELGDYPASLEYLQRKLSLAYQLQSRESEAHALSNMGNTYACLENYEEAIRCQHASIEHFRDIGDRWGCAAAMCNLGDAYRLSEDFDQAALWLLNSLIIFDALQAAQIETVMLLLTQVAFSVGIENYIELLEKHLLAIQVEQGEEIVQSLRSHLFE